MMNKNEILATSISKLFKSDSNDNYIFIYNQKMYIYKKIHLIYRIELYTANKFY